MGDKTRVVKEMCEGGGCFAKTSRERALEIERQIEESKTFSKKRRRRA